MSLLVHRPHQGQSQRARPSFCGNLNFRGKREFFTLQEVVSWLHMYPGSQASSAVPQWVAVLGPRRSPKLQRLRRRGLMCLYLLPWFWKMRLGWPSKCAEDILSGFCWPITGGLTLHKELAEEIGTPAATLPLIPQLYQCSLRQEGDPHGVSQTMEPPEAAKTMTRARVMNDLLVPGIRQQNGCAISHALTRSGGPETTTPVLVTTVICPT